MLCLAVLLAACERPDNRARDFSLSDIDGRVVTLSALRGKTVLLEFWATWCKPCHEELPGLIAIQKEADPAVFTIVSATQDEEDELVRRFAREKGLPYPVIATHGELREPYGVDGFPRAFLIDCKGRILKHYDGAKELPGLKEDIAWGIKTCGQREIYDLFGGS